MKIKMSAIDEALKGYMREKYIINNLDVYIRVERLENKVYYLRSELKFLIEENGWDSNMIDDDNLFEVKQQEFDKEFNKRTALINELLYLRDKNYTLIQIITGKRMRDRRRIKTIVFQLNCSYQDENFSRFRNYFLARLEYLSQYEEYKKIKNALKYPIGYDNINLYWLSCSKVMRDLYIRDIDNKILQLEDIRKNNGEIEIKDFNNISKLLKFLGWHWHDWCDGSGSLKSPINKSYFNYDYFENEYKYLDDHYYSYDLSEFDEYKQYAEKEIFEKIILEE